VVVCTLNRCASLRRTLEGLAQQTFRRFEVIVVNGPSSDGTAELLSGYPVRVGVCSETHVPRSRNVGVRMAAGDVFAFLDDDAVPEPDWLEQLAGAYEDPTVAAAGGPVFDVPLGRIEWAICTCTREGAVNTHSEPPAERYLGRGADPFLYLPGCNMSVRRSALRRAGAFNPELPYCYEDTEVCMRLVDAGARIAWVEAALVRHDRAASWLRDDGQAITDPYSLMFSAAVFIEQSSPTSAPKVLGNWLATWKSEPAERVPEERRAWFRERVEQGIADGVRAGRRPRERVGLGRRRRGDFKPYA
jgi:GT2 family glycosyltransferase